jgi:hypothetical protein
LHFTANPASSREDKAAQKAFSHPNLYPKNGLNELNRLFYKKHPRNDLIIARIRILVSFIGRKRYVIFKDLCTKTLFLNERRNLLLCCLFSLFAFSDN